MAQSFCIYSHNNPDLNPIKNMWSKIKQLLRGMKMRACDALKKGTASVLDSVYTNDAPGGLRNCGYELLQE